MGYGGVSLVQRACGLSRKAIAKGIADVQGGSRTLVGRVSRPGAGRKSITKFDPHLVETLEGLIDEQTRGDPESALRWICKSTRAIAWALGQQNHPVSHMKVAQILHDLNYSLQSNRKTEWDLRPGTSKWNKIAHRLFSFISSNWRGEPLRDYETVVNLIAKTTTARRLRVTCRLDRRKYPTGREVTHAQMERVNMKRNITQLANPITNRFDVSNGIDPSHHGFHTLRE